MNLAEEAFQQLYPEKEQNHDFLLKYSAKFKPYNANIRRIGNKLEFNLSKKWLKISKEIQMGLIQELILKIFKDKKKTVNIDLYNSFMRNIHLAVPKTESNPLLEQSFNRVNETYFNGLMEKPNLVFGSDSRRKLGSYEYGSDTIIISKVFLKAPLRLLDYIMYHELLHKQHKFISKNNRNYHHNREFKKKEEEYRDFRAIERELNSFLRTKQKILNRGFSLFRLFKR
tara:strand:+ start:191 stop:874 length:684 start_codon:yes stop_codon:yes gene_type:complete